MYIILLLTACYNKDQQPPPPVPPPVVEAHEPAEDTGEELDISTKEAAEQGFEGWCLSGT
jgi:hypothetical protein